MADGLNPFHLAVPVNDQSAAQAFYCGVLGCDTGRTAERLEGAACEFKSFADASQLFAT